MGPIRWGVIMAITGKKWGTGVHIPWSNWPPTQSPTVPIVLGPTQYEEPEIPPDVNPNLTERPRSKLHKLLSRFPDI